MQSRYSFLGEIYLSEAIICVICIILFQRKNNGRNCEEVTSLITQMVVNESPSLFYFTVNYFPFILCFNRLNITMIPDNEF